MKDAIRCKTAPDPSSVLEQPHLAVELACSNATRGSCHEHQVTWTGRRSVSGLIPG